MKKGMSKEHSVLRYEAENKWKEIGVDFKRIAYIFADEADFMHLI